MVKRRKSATPRKHAEDDPDTGHQERKSFVSQSPQRFIVGTRTYKISKTLLREIRRLQTTTRLCIPTSRFYKLVREIVMMATASAKRLRIQLAALEGLQEAAELYLVQLLEDANKCAILAKRITLQTADLQLVRNLRGISDPGN